jgi:hypothetical protein
MEDGEKRESWEQTRRCKAKQKDEVQLVRRSGEKEVRRCKEGSRGRSEEVKQSESMNWEVTRRGKEGKTKCSAEQSRAVQSSS